MAGEADYPRIVRGQVDTYMDSAHRFVEGSVQSSLDSAMTWLDRIEGTQESEGDEDGAVRTYEVREEVQAIHLQSVALAKSIEHFRRRWNRDNEKE